MDALTSNTSARSDIAERNRNGSRGVLAKLSPPITKMIRADHSHVMVTSHQYTADAPDSKKKAIVKSICLALEIHAQLEEEIFYPALREVDADGEVLGKSASEHDEMRRLIEQLRGMEPGDAAYDTTFAELMRDVIHHVADEETVLLPAAERLLKDRLCALGAQMMRRRLQLAAPHAGEMALATARVIPTRTMLVAGGLLAGAYLLGRQATANRRH
jgi:hemerythrin superfamily protein